MSALHDPTWLDFDGTPITGRAAPSLVVEGGQLDRAQEADLKRAYQAFRMARRVAPDKFLTRRTELSDGTQVLMATAQDRDVVRVQVQADKVQDRLPHGFVVVADWSVPAIHGKTDLGWKRYPNAVPQAQKDILGYDSVNAQPYPGVFYPTVRWRATSWALYKATAHDEGDVDLLPFVIYAQDTSHFDHRSTYYGRDNKLYSARGSVRYTMNPPGSLSVSSPEAMNWWPPATDTQASLVVLQGWRAATISDVSWVLRIGTETVTSPTKGSFARSSRTDVDLYVSSSASAASVSKDINRDDLGEQAPGSGIYLKQWTRNLSGGHSVSNNYYTGPFSGTSYVVQTCFYFSEVHQVTIPTYAIRSHNGYMEDHAESGGATTTTNNILALPKTSGVDRLSWSSNCSYPNTWYWRTGWDRASSNRGDIIGLGVPWWFGVFAYEIRRKDSQYTRNFAPLVSIDVPWIPNGFKVFEGSGKGELTGRWHVDYEDRHHNLEETPPYSAGGTIYCKDVVQFIQDYSTDPPPLFVWVEMGRITMNMILNGEINGQVTKTRLDHTDDKLTTLAKEHPHNTINYTATSRYMIDYDHRSQFAAWLKVVVTCSGAEWRGNLDDTHAPGLLYKVSDPTYSVQIFFESRWRKKEFSKLLARADSVRPCFEAQVLRKTNPYSWPAPDQPPLEFYMPPGIGVPYAATTQLSNFARHQGLNPHYVGAAVDLDEKKKSPTGIEYSYERAEGVYFAPRRWVDGMLYARTFKLSDISDALWLLGALNLSCAQNGDNDGSWYYFPALKAVINSQAFHIELRDGDEVQWSDDVPARSGTSRPERPDARVNLKLYQV